MSFAQCGSWIDKAKDLTTDGFITISNDRQVYMGLIEYKIESEADIVKYFKIVEKNRYTDGTKMNQTSSRTSAVVEFKIYRVYDDGTLRENSARFADMTGSERLDKAGNDSGPTDNFGQNLNGMSNNYSLHFF
jgi:hypothetical protein